MKQGNDDHLPASVSGRAELLRQKTLSPLPTGLRSRSRSPAHGNSAQAASEHLLRSGEPNDLPNASDPVEPKSSRPPPVKWRELPRKDQLLALTLARIAEPITQTSLGAYVFYMLKSFDETKPDSEIASQAGLLQASFTAAQCLTSIWWGRLADKPWMGRKNVVLISLAGTMISSMGFGFSNSFTTAVCFRALGGFLNGNIGVMRTMISEIIKEKKYQVKAFVLLPLTFNIGIVIGPILGGWLQDPINTFPGIFGPGSRLGGENGVQWMIDYPYALPNLVTSGFLFFSVFLVFLALEETHIDRREYRDIGIELGRALFRMVTGLFRRKRESSTEYSRLGQDGLELDNAHQVSTSDQQGPGFSTRHQPKRPRPKLPYRRIFTRNICCTFFLLCLLHTNISAFQTMWFLFLSTPRQADPFEGSSSPLAFAGGLGLKPSTIGFAIGIMGVMGLSLQIGIYSRVIDRLGLLRAFRSSILLLPIPYIVTPFLVLIPTLSTPPAAANGPWIWIVMVLILFCLILARTFALPPMAILINNATPHPSVLAAVHGLGQSVSTGSRTLGPALFSWLYGYGLDRGVVGLAWWVLAIVALCSFCASLLVYEGSGHEIWLEGDEDT